MRRSFGVLVALTAVLAAGAAQAQSNQQLVDTCYSSSASDDDTISTCTTLIDSGQYSGVELSHLYNNRGTGYDGKGQLDLALSDYGKALQLDGTNAEAANNLGVVYYKQANYRSAIQQYDVAIRLRPDYANAYRNRGHAKQKLGDTAGGQADLDTAARLEAQSK